MIFSTMPRIRSISFCWILWNLFNAARHRLPQYHLFLTLMTPCNCKFVFSLSNRRNNLLWFDLICLNFYLILIWFYLICLIRILFVNLSPPNIFGWIQNIRLFQIFLWTDRVNMLRLQTLFKGWPVQIKTVALIWETLRKIY